MNLHLAKGIARSLRSCNLTLSNPAFLDLVWWFAYRKVH